jgi:transcriptional regulator with XRE-family HTH domain
MLPVSTKALRESRGLTQEQAAQQTGFKITTIQKWDCGRSVNSKTRKLYIAALRAVRATQRNGGK